MSPFLPATFLPSDFFTQAGSDEQARVRLSNATGFALLQLQRGEVPADWQQLSETPPWVVLAYHTLKLCMPGAGGREVTPQDYVTFNFWGSEMVSTQVQQRPCYLPNKPWQKHWTSIKILLLWRDVQW